MRSASKTSLCRGRAPRPYFCGPLRDLVADRHALASYITPHSHWRHVVARLSCGVLARARSSHTCVAFSSLAYASDPRPVAGSLKPNASSTSMDRIDDASAYRRPSCAMHRSRTMSKAFCVASHPGGRCAGNADRTMSRGSTSHTAVSSHISRAAYVRLHGAGAIQKSSAPAKKRGARALRGRPPAAAPRYEVEVVQQLHGRSVPVAGRGSAALVHRGYGRAHAHGATVL